MRKSKQEPNILLRFWSRQLAEHAEFVSLFCNLQKQHGLLSQANLMEDSWESLGNQWAHSKLDEEKTLGLLSRTIVALRLLIAEQNLVSAKALDPECLLIRLPHILFRHMLTETLHFQDQYKKNLQLCTPAESGTLEKDLNASFWLEHNTQVQEVGPLLKELVSEYDMSRVPEKVVQKLAFSLLPQQKPMETEQIIVQALTQHEKREIQFAEQHKAF
jgi:hypothetical protein